MQKNTETRKTKIKTNKKKQKLQKTKTHKNRKYANYTMNAIYLIYNRVSGQNLKKTKKKNLIKILNQINK